MRELFLDNDKLSQQANSPQGRPRLNVILTAWCALLSAGSCNDLKVGDDPGAITTTDGNSEISVTIDQFQSKSLIDQLRDSKGVINTKDTTLTVAGTCTRGAVKVQLRINGAIATEQGTCAKNMTYSWSHPVTSDGTYTLSAYPIYESGQSAPKASVTLPVVVDTIPPDPPVILTNNGGDFISSTASFTLNGTIAADTVTLTASDSKGKLVFNTKTKTFTFNDTLKPGQSLQFRLSATDTAGNTSTSSTVHVGYLTTVQLSAENMSAVGLQTPITGTSGQIELSTASMSPWIISGGSVISPQHGFQLSTGTVQMHE